MIIRDNFNLTYDLSGNIIITIPKSYIQHTEQKILIESIERLIHSAKENVKGDWSNDAATDIVGICQSDVTDGAAHHDRYIYGLDK